MLKESKEKPAKFRPTTCVDYLRRRSSKNGIYKLYDSNGNSYAVYCDLKSEPGTAWTLVMSWSSRNRGLSKFRSIPFKINAPVNETAQNWNQYRLSLARMRSLQAYSTHWRATCSYPTHGIDFRDYLRGNFKDFDIVDYIGSGECKRVEYINIRGHVGKNLTVAFWQFLHEGLHTDSWFLNTDCQIKVIKSGAVRDEDNFGWYRTLNPKFRCTKDNQSTTQWWFGAHL